MLTYPVTIVHTLIHLLLIIYTSLYQSSATSDGCPLAALHTIYHASSSADRVLEKIKNAEELLERRWNYEVLGIPLWALLILDLGGTRWYPQSTRRAAPYLELRWVLTFCETVHGQVSRVLRMLWKTQWRNRRSGTYISYISKYHQIHIYI